MKIKAVLALLLLVVLPFMAEAAQVKVAVASNFLPAMKKLAENFQRQTGHQVVLSSASSGKLFAQISQGAPFEVFFSADQSKPQALVEQHRAIASSRFTYATGTLVLTASKPDTDVLVALQGGQYKKLAVANPRLAPYGVAAIEVLTNLGIYPQAAARLVRGENISQTYQFVSTGNVDLAFVALSQLASRGDQRVWIVPQKLYSPIRQDAVILNKGVNNVAAVQLMDFIKGDEAIRLIKSYGYNQF